jgi:ABC-type sugar transport system ATPase subunit
VQVLATCDRINLIQDGAIALDKRASETSVKELTEIVVSEYRRAGAPEMAEGVTVTRAEGGSE